MRRRTIWLLAGYALLGLLALLIVPRTSYRPGKLLRSHAALDRQCAACHRPWHGADNHGCIACHGDFAENNPHGGFDVTDQHDGVIAEAHLVTFQNELSCLSCHSEHRGRAVKIKTQAAFNCAFCHKHAANGKVAEHTVPSLKRHESGNHLFKQPFNHYQHRLLMALQAENFPQGFQCTTCHQVTPARPGAPDQMSIAWSPCANCHISPQDSSLQLPARLGRSPANLLYSSAVRVLHVNAVFNHSSGHLHTPCAQCHFKVSSSGNPDDEPSLLISQCFSCHAHQEAAAGHATETRTEGLAQVAMAALAADRRVVACGECHWFHFHGPVPTRDFPAAASIRMLAAGGAAVPARHSPWGIGAVALMIISLSAAMYTILLPHPTEHEAVTEHAPQRILKTPVLDDAYQTSIPGLYIVGELGGTASINLAMRSGRQVIESIAENLRHTPPPLAENLYDVVIVGCGPAGLGATATAKSKGLSYVTLERMTPASTLRTYPRAKFVQATPIDILEYGSFFLEGDTSREDLIREWGKIISQVGLIIQDREEVVGIARQADFLVVSTVQGHEFKSRCVVLALGLRGHPRRLEVPGEEPGRVHYQLIEPDDYRDQKILVVGGGNAGAEVAQALAAPHLGNTVSYSWRDAALTKVTHENAVRIAAAQRSGAIVLYPATAVREIIPGKVILEPVAGHLRNPGGRAPATSIELANDVIFAMLGAELPTRFLESLGIRMEVKHR